MTTELSGIDLARQALIAAREAAKKNGAVRKKMPKRRTGTARRHDGREPIGLGALFGNLVIDRAWEIPAAGGNILDQWPTIAASVSPHLAAHVEAMAFYSETGQLDLRPDSSAYATQLRLVSSRIVTAANDAVGRQAVRVVRVLAVGQVSVPQPRQAVSGTAAAVSEAPVRTRETASAGFHRALAAHQAVPRTREVTLDIAEAAAQQIHALRELRRSAFPDPEESANQQPAPVDSVLRRRREFAATETAALHRARADRARRLGGAPFPQQAAQQDGGATPPAPGISRTSTGPLHFHHVLGGQQGEVT